jgi:hypothetical protein
LALAAVPPVDAVRKHPFSPFIPSSDEPGMSKPKHSPYHFRAKKPGMAAGIA